MASATIPIGDVEKYGLKALAIQHERWEAYRKAPKDAREIPCPHRDLHCAQVMVTSVYHAMELGVSHLLCNSDEMALLRQGREALKEEEG